MLKSIRQVISNNDMEVKVYKNKIDVINYNEIGHFDNSKIIIKGQFVITINGKDLVISKLFNDELLITGKVDNILTGDK